MLIASSLFLMGFVANPVFNFGRQTFLMPRFKNAIEKGDTIQVRTLLNLGADPNHHYLGLIGGTPLWSAMKAQNIEMMKLLIDAGARVNEKDRGVAPIMLAITPEIAKVLLDRGADPRTCDSKGHTVWQLKKYAGLDEVAKMIMKYENLSKGSF